MKKIILLLCMLFVSGMAEAQRFTDFSIVVRKPADRDTVYGDTVQVSGEFYLINNGPDTTRPGDTILFNVAMDTFVYPAMVYVQTNLKPGDTIKRIQSFGFVELLDNKIDLCFSVACMNANDTLVDTVAGNDESCLTLIRRPKPKPTGIKGTDNQLATVSVSPNPANDEANFLVKLQKAGDIFLHISDMTGKVMIRRTVSSAGQATERIDVNTSAMPAGLYIYTIRTGNEQMHGKLRVL